MAEERIGNLDQYAGAVAHQRIGAHGATMVEIDQELEPLADNGMRLRTLDVGDKADATGIVLVTRVVQTLFRRQAHLKTPNALSQTEVPVPPPI